MTTFLKIIFFSAAMRKKTQFFQNQIRFSTILAVNFNYYARFYMYLPTLSDTLWRAHIPTHSCSRGCMGEVNIIKIVVNHPSS
jgi:hypothetical protein